MIAFNAYLSGQLSFSTPKHYVYFAIINEEVDNMAVIYQTVPPVLFKTLIVNLNRNKKINGYVINSQGNVFGISPIPVSVKALATKLKAKKLSEKPFQRKQWLVSKEVKILGKHNIRLVVDIKSMTSAKEKRWLFTLLKIRFIGAFVLALIFSVFLTIFIKYRISKSFFIIDKISKGDFVEHTTIKDVKTNTGVEVLNSKLHDMSQKIQAMIDSKNRLLVDISHELRSPLSRQEIAIDIAKIKINSLESPFLERIELENHRLQALINEILAFSKENQSEYQPILESFSLTGLFHELLIDAQFEFPNAKIFLKAAEDFKITADPCLLHRGFENILRNALKHANKSDPKVLISITFIGEQYEISIQDNGPGVLEHNLNLIFSPFYREERQTDMRNSGYGLGLSIAKSIIAVHHGSIVARNLKPNGLEIVIKLSTRI